MKKEAIHEIHDQTFFSKRAFYEERKEAKGN